MKTTTVPAEVDEDGNMISPELQMDMINYTGLFPYLIAGYQELSARVSTLEAQPAATDQAKMLQTNPDYEQNVKLTNTPTPILYQNTPNPHKGECTIKYFVPQFNANCEVQFFDMYGNAIHTEPVTQTGIGQLNIDVHNLASGSYSYALVIDGVVVATRIMIKE
ncbi:MAG: T9SS type A sorting domain-containing protein [Flavobacteriales bacterium]|nr:T9SS type A sorting domain-containing protein [Flavobacteriales bacterium]